MSFLFGSTPKVIPEFTGLQVNTAVQVLPVPIIYGSTRVPINLVYYNGFNVQLVDASGGKGVLTGGKGGQQVEYFATIILAIGEGTIPGIFIIYQDQAVYTPADFPTNNGATYFDGSPGQEPWSVVVTKWPVDARPYKDTAYYAFDNAELDSSATVPQINLLPKGIFMNTSPLNNSSITIATGQYDQNGNPISFIGVIPIGNCDADPGQVILDFLTNNQYGAGFPGNYVRQETLLSSGPAYDPDTGDQAVSTYCQAVGLAWSVALSNAESGNSILDRWTTNMAVAAVWDGEKLGFYPYWDGYASINPGYYADNPLGIPMKYFNPVTVTNVIITLDHILVPDNKTDDPITWSRKDPMEVYNTVRVDFKDRSNFFNDNVCEAKDEAHVELYGPRVDNIGLANEYSLIDYANISAAVQLKRQIAIMREFTFKLGPLWGWLVPMNIIQIPNPSNWFQNLIVRVISVEDDEDENVTIVAEEFPVGALSPIVITPPPTTAPNQGATNIPTAPAFPPVLFEPTTAMLTATGFSEPQYIIGASGGYNGVFDSFWGGYKVWLSNNDVDYEVQPGIQQGPSLIGLLSLPLVPGGNITVNMQESQTTLGNTTSGLAAIGQNLCVLQDASGIELISYTTATLVGPDTYELTGVFRGWYGTTERSFGVGSKFLFCGPTGNFFERSLPPQYVGQTFWVKLQCFNVYNNAFQDLSTVPAYQILVGGSTPVAPVPPAAMQQINYRRHQVLGNAAPLRPRPFRR